jgi:hypothetical protein
MDGHVEVDEWYIEKMETNVLLDFRVYAPSW